MKKILMAMMVAICMLTIGSGAEVQASNMWDTRTGIAVDHEWNITMNLPVEIQSVRNSVAIVDESGREIALNHKLDSTGRIIRVSPKAKLDHESSYSLLIREGLRASNGRTLKTSARLNFVTEKAPEIPLEQRVLGSWNTRYDGIGARITFENNNVCRAFALGMAVTGSYSIDGDQMTVSLMGSTRTGKVVFDGANKFSVVSSGSRLDFWK